MYIPMHMGLPWLYGNWIYNYLCNQCLLTLLTRKLLNQVFLLVKLKPLLRKFDMVDRYGITVSQMTMDMFHLS